ncbi:hypothetical protein [Kamptonema sp. UHCC 0994]|uniref:hypothetical protein n=1 Tax=Kamptonema sp. UHCC 0994 TaxID=3031329 RepID=UPI0023B8E4CC|nr:hypothetical protein [Kamptonema sp. UHCC 0994]MDF0554901.1 hypothetical protein [Kamptonema sp. UHCC 0994]
MKTPEKMKRLGFVPVSIWYQICFLALKEEREPKELLVQALEEFVSSRGLKPYAQVGEK